MLISLPKPPYLLKKRDCIRVLLSSLFYPKLDELALDLLALSFGV